MHPTNRAGERFDVLVAAALVASRLVSAGARPTESEVQQVLAGV